LRCTIRWSGWGWRVLEAAQAEAYRFRYSTSALGSSIISSVPARARKGIGYTIQLPRDVARPWPPDLIAYWNALGDQVGAAARPIRPPEIFAGLETRAVLIPPAVVLACEPVDLDIILERPNLSGPERFDLIVGTNIFVYYDAFEQMLALENAGAMLKPGGLLLTNDRLPERAEGSIHLAGVTEVPFDVGGVKAPDVVGWYQRAP
jgi:hypothetical protein